MSLYTNTTQLLESRRLHVYRIIIITLIRTPQIETPRLCAFKPKPACTHYCIIHIRTYIHVQCTSQSYPHHLQFNCRSNLCTCALSRFQPRKHIVEYARGTICGYVYMYYKCSLLMYIRTYGVSPRDYYVRERGSFTDESILLNYRSYIPLI